jgi:cytochrome c553
MRNWLFPLLAVLASLAGCGRAPAPAPEPAVSTALASGPAAPAQLGLCASCHGRDGIAVIPDTPNLAGRDRAELLAAMQAYLDGSRDYPPMRAMLGPIRPADRERLADWFAAQQAPDGTDADPVAPGAGAPAAAVPDATSSLPDEDESASTPALVPDPGPRTVPE